MLKNHNDYDGRELSEPPLTGWLRPQSRWEVKSTHFKALSGQSLTAVELTGQFEVLAGGTAYAYKMASLFHAIPQFP